MSDSLGVDPAFDPDDLDLVAPGQERFSNGGHGARVGALVGLAVGGLAGLLGASEFCSGSSSCGAKQYTVGVLLGGAAGAGLGALIGAAVGGS